MKTPTTSVANFKFCSYKTVTSSFMLTEKDQILEAQFNIWYDDYNTLIERTVLYMRKFWQGKTLANLVNHEPFAVPIFTDAQKMYSYGICTDCCLFTKFLLAYSFYLHNSPKISPANHIYSYYSNRSVLLEQLPKCICDWI